MSTGLRTVVNNCRQKLDAFDGLPAVVVLRRFFMGRLYPALFALLVLVGHLTGTELYLNILLMSAVIASLLVCHSARPLLIAVLTFVYQLSRRNGPGVPSYSDYLFSGFRLWVLVITMALVALALLYFVLRRGLLRGIGFRRVRLLLPLLVLGTSFLLNGAFSSGWDARGLGYGALQTVSFVLPYLLFYLGLRGEGREQIISYFVYVSALLSLLLTFEVVGLYIFTPGVIVGGEVVKESILFGWGTWNTAGVALAVLIPTLFIGVLKSKYSIAYFGVALATLGASVMTLSRNALLFGGLAFAVCTVIACSASRHKWFYRIFLSAGASATTIAVILLWDRIPGALSGFLADNGRYALWRAGIESFLSAPVFGSGYYAFSFPPDPTYFKGAAFLPSLAHNTVISLLSGGGILGLLGYLFYRISTVVPFVRRPSVTKTLLGLSALTLLLMSLLDNFAFCFFNTFHYSAALAIAELMRDGEKDAVEIN